jgi:hypothetical protein
LRTATKKLAGGMVVYYACAWQGGPLIAKGEGGTRDAARDNLETQLATPSAMAKLAAGRETQLIRPTPSVAYIAGIVQAHLKSPEWARLAPRTKGDWRDSHPSLRQGQMRMDVVSRLFSWARSRGMTTAPPTEPLERIYKADRSDIIWTESEVEKSAPIPTRPCNGRYSSPSKPGYGRATLSRCPGLPSAMWRSGTEPPSAARMLSFRSRPRCARRWRISRSGHLLSLQALRAAPGRDSAFAPALTPQRSEHESRA